MKPIEHSYHRHVEAEVENESTEENQTSGNVSYNEMFGGRSRRKNEMVTSREKRTMKRTERSRNRHY